MHLGPYPLDQTATRTKDVGPALWMRQLKPTMTIHLRNLVTVGRSADILPEPELVSQISRYVGGPNPKIGAVQDQTVIAGNGN